MRRVRLSILLLSSTLVGGLALGAGCGGDDSNNGGGGDASTDSGGVDSGKKDGGITPRPDGGGTDASMQQDGNVPPTDSGGTDGNMAADVGVDAGPFTCLGKQLVAGNFAIPTGLGPTVTTDGYVPYSDGTKAWVVKVDGTEQPIMITTGLNPNTIFQVQGNAVLVWTAPGAAAPHVSTLWVWTKANGAHMLASSSLADGFVAAVDPTGTYAIYTSLVDLKGTHGNLELQKTDGTGMVTLETGVNLTSKCTLSVGMTSTQKAIAAHCSATVDAGTGGASLDAYATPAGTKTNLSTAVIPNTLAFTISKDGTKVAALDAKFNVKVFDDTTAAATQIDTFGSVPGPFITADTHLVYTASDSMGMNGAVKSSPVAAPLPLTLAPINATNGGIFFEPVDPSPDQNWMVYFDNIDQNTFATDLLITSTTAPGMSRTIKSTVDNFIFGDAFTQDSSHLLYYDNTSTVGQGLVGRLNSLAILPANSTPVSWGNTVWLSWALTGSKAAYNDNTQASTPQRADLAYGDMAAAAPAPTMICPSADVNFTVTTDRKTVVYSYSARGAENGIYAYTVP